MTETTDPRIAPTHPYRRATVALATDPMGQPLVWVLELGGDDAAVVEMAFATEASAVAELDRRAAMRPEVDAVDEPGVFHGRTSDVDGWVATVAPTPLVG